MIQDPPLQHEWIGQTTLHPLGLTAILLGGIATLMVSRRHALLPLLTIACFVAPAQRIVLLGLDLDSMRLMVLFGFVRLVARNEWRGLRWCALDRVIVAWCLAGAIGYTARLGTWDGVITQLGEKYDFLGVYFLARLLLRDWEDLDRTVLGLIVLSVPVSIVFLIESATGRNYFSVLGGVPEMTMIRMGRLRCQGAFAHPILAGCFWAAVMPLFAARAWRPRGGTSAAIGLLAAGLVVLTCSSSTPVMGVVFGLVGLCAFPLRAQLRWVRLGIVIVLFSLHLLMNKPVWHLMARLDVVGGSTAWHRFYLVDEFIRHFDEWWLCGGPSAQWGEGLVDVTNQFVLQGTESGLATLVLFVAVLALAFGEVGRVCRVMADSPARLAAAWGLGTALFVHVMSFLGVSYFGQINALLFLNLAAIASVGQQAALTRRRPPMRARSSGPALVP
jgi:hypothetical protein